MAWDSTKSPGDLISSADYNSGVTDQKTRGVPASEAKLGSDCTGVNAGSNRTLTLAETTIKSSGIIIIKNGTGLHEGAGLDYTISSGVITFIGPVWDVDKIRVIYFI
jgi:hypothetical protein